MLTDRMRAEQENGRNYLKIILEKTEEIDEECLAAISEEEVEDGSQEIKGIIPAIYSEVFQERILRYDVSVFQPFSEYKKQIYAKEPIVKLFLSILDIYSQMEAFLVNPAYFLPEERCVYVERDSGRANLILYPVLSAAKEGDLDFRSLFLQMMQGIRLPETEMAFYGTVMCELSQPTFNVVKFRELLTGGQEEDTKSNPKNGGSAGVRTPSGNGQGGEKSGAKPPVKGTKTMDVGRETPNVSSVSSPKASQDEEIQKKENEQKTADGNGGLFAKWFGKDKPMKEPKKPTPPKGTKSTETFPKGAGKAGQTGKSGRSGSFLTLPDEEVPAVGSMAAPVQEAIGQDRFLEPPNHKGTNGKGAEILPMTDDEDISAYGATADDEKEEPYIVLYYVNEDKYITVRNFPFEIGREAKGYRIDASKTKVSRKHVEIIFSKGGFQVCDCSKLGTWLNDMQIPKESYVALMDGAKLSLKGEEFRVKIYGL